MRKVMERATVCLIVLGLLTGSVSCIGPSVTFGGDGSSRRQDRTRGALKGAHALRGLALAASLAAAVPKLLDDFRARRRELLANSGDTGYPEDGVAALLDSTEASLNRKLEGAELAPLRDHVAAVFQQARGDLGLPPAAARVPPSAPLVVLASLRLVPWDHASSESRLDRRFADPVLDALEVFLTALGERATRRELTVDLCVVSNPKGAKVLLRAKSSRNGERRKTIARFENLYRGRYCYEVTGKGFNIPCGAALEDQINIFDKRQPFLECERSDQSCDLREGWPQTCRGR
jgi:hypothetical protein